MTGMIWELLGVVDSNLSFEGEGKPCQVREKQARSQEANPAQIVLRSREQSLLTPTAGSSRRQRICRGEAGISPFPHT